MKKTPVYVAGTIFLCLSALLVSSGCRDEDNTVKYRWPSKYSTAGEATIDKDTRTNAESYTIAAANMAKSYSEATEEIYKGMAGISADYTKDINATATFTQTAMDSYTDAIAKALDKYASAFLYGYDAAYFLRNGIVDKRTSSYFIKRDLTPTVSMPENIPGQSTQLTDYANDFGYLGFIPYRDFDLLISAVEERIKNGSFIISSTVEGSDEHKKINSALSIPETSSKTETSAAYEALNVKSKLLMLKKFEAINRQYAEGSAIPQSRDAIVRSCNSMVNSFKTTAPGNLYDSKDVESEKTKLGFLLKAIGQDPESVVATYMAMSANSISKSEGTIATLVGLVLSSKEGSFVQIPPPDQETETDAAKTTLKNMASSIYTDIFNSSKIKNALNAYSHSEANDLYPQGIISTEGDGSLKISIPARNYARFLSKPNNNKSFRTPDFDTTECLVTMNGYVPEIYFNLDIIPSGFSIGVEYANVNSLSQKLTSIPSDKNIALATLIHPANIDEKPEQDRNFMIFANPLSEGIKISYETVGGDKWDQAGEPSTNQSGYVEFFMPASPDDTEDSVTIKYGKEIVKKFLFKL